MNANSDQVTVLEKDYLKTTKISLKNIKNLVSHYQIVKSPYLPADPQRLDKKCFYPR